MRFQSIASQDNPQQSKEAEIVARQDQIVSYSIVMCTRRHFCLLQKLNAKLGHLSAFDPIDYWNFEVLLRKLSNEQESSQPQQISIEEVSEIFTILGFGYLATFMVFCFELSHKMRRKKFLLPSSCGGKLFDVRSSESFDRRKKLRNFPRRLRRLSRNHPEFRLLAEMNSKRLRQDTTSQCDGINELWIFNDSITRERRSAVKLNSCVSFRSPFAAALRHKKVA